VEKLAAETDPGRKLEKSSVAIWDMQPDHDAYSFVDYAQSSNLVVMELETALSAVPTSSLSLPIKPRDLKRKTIPLVARAR
jgi:hypothetical protein